MEIAGEFKVMGPFEPKILTFLCNWCSYAGADLAGVSRFQYPPTTRVLRVMCSGRVDPLHITEGLRSGFDSVLVFGCHPGDCHYLDGNIYAAQRIKVVQQLMDLSGIGRERVQLRWVSAAEGQLFSDYINELSSITRELGRFDAEGFKIGLGAVERALSSSRLRWLMGMDRQLTERENVYHERIDEEQYRQMLDSAVEREYQKALVMEVLRGGPQTVREIAAASHLPIHTISLRLGDLEKSSSVDLFGYEGTTPKFVGLEA